MKYNVVEVTFGRPVSAFGSQAWFATAKQGGYEEAELDTDTGILTFKGRAAGLKTRRVHVTNTVDMVFGATKAATKDGQL